MIRKAVEQDIPRLMELLHQVNKVHHDLRPDLFKPDTTKYDEAQLLRLLADESTPVFVYEQMSVLGYAFVRMDQTLGDMLLQDRRTCGRCAAKSTTSSMRDSAVRRQERRERSPSGLFLFEKRISGANNKL